MSDGAKRWDAVLHIIEVKEPKLFAYFQHGRYKDESQLNVTLVAASEADAEEVRKGERVYDAVIELCTTTVYGEKRGIKVNVSPEEYAAAAPIGVGTGTARGAAPVPATLPPAPPVKPADPRAAMEAQMREAVEAEFRAKIDEEVRKRIEAKAREETEREEARTRAVEAEKGRRLSVIQGAEELSAQLSHRLFEMKNVAHPDQAWKLRPLLDEASALLERIGQALPAIDRREDRPGTDA